MPQRTTKKNKRKSKIVKTMRYARRLKSKKKKTTSKRKQKSYKRTVKTTKKKTKRRTPKRSLIKIRKRSISRTKKRPARFTKTTKKKTIGKHRSKKTVRNKKIVRRKKRHTRAPRMSAGSTKKYILNGNFEFFKELRDLILKASPAERNTMIKRISGIGRVKLAVISGVFLNQTNTVESYSSVADLLIVGDDINRKRLRTFLRSLEAEIGAEVKFTLMDRDEFVYRYGMFDRFIRVFLEGPHEKLINRLGI